ncbi:MAG: hypothetical protein LUE26_08420 [Alistipes sp.]|nr:hypothetical protein [Alistipes sp.]
MSRNDKYHKKGFVLMWAAPLVLIGGVLVAHNINIYNVGFFWGLLVLSILLLTAGTVIFFKGGKYREPKPTGLYILWPAALLFLVTVVIPNISQSLQEGNGPAAFAFMASAIAAIYVPVFGTLNYIVSRKSNKKP